MDLRSVKLTMLMNFSSNINLRNLYELMPCVKINDFVFDKKKSLEFLGVNNIFVSLKSHIWGCRGVRCQTINNDNYGSMKNSVSIDYQFENENYNIKIFSELAHLSKTTDIEFCKRFSKTLIYEFSFVNSSWRPFFLLPYEDRKNLITCLLFPIVFNKDGTIRNLEHPDLHEKYNEYNGEYKNVLRSMIGFLDFYPTIEEYFEKLNKICVLESINGNSIFTEDQIHIKSYDVIEGVHSCSIPHKNINLIHLTQKLMDKGHELSFFNERSRSVKIVNKIGLENRTVNKTSSRDPANQITISDTGQVKINSPGFPNLVSNVWSTIHKDVNDIINCEEYPSDDINSVIGRMRTILAEKKKKIMDNHRNSSDTKHVSEW